MADTGDMTPDDIRAYHNARVTLAAKVARLKALRVRAVKIGANQPVRVIDARLKEAALYQAQMVRLDKMVAPLLQAAGWIRDKATWAAGASGLGNLGLVQIGWPLVVVAGIAAFVYAVGRWAANTETAAERLDAEISGREKFIKAGYSPSEAGLMVNSATAQLSAEKQAFGLPSVVLWAGAALLAWRLVGHRG